MNEPMPVTHEQMRSLIESDNSRKHLGFEVESASEGRATVTLVIGTDMVNGLGVAQGGYTFAVADTALAMAANSVCYGTATTEASITYLSPARAGEMLVAEAKVVLVDGRRTVIDVVVRAGQRTVALMRGQGRLLRSPESI